MNPNVTAYIQQQESWKQKVLETIRAVIHKVDSEIEESIKWGTPSFEHNGQVVWVFCATEWVHLSFRQGALLNVPAGTWEEGADTNSQAKRTMKFYRDKAIPVTLIERLVGEAVANNINGKKVEFHVTKPGSQVFQLPLDYKEVLFEHDALDLYLKRPYYQQKGWIQWIESAKQDVTRKKRIAKMIEELEEGSYMPPKVG